MMARGMDDQWQKEEMLLMSDRAELVKTLNERLAELHELWRKDHYSMDVFLRREVDRYASEQMLGQVLSDVDEEIHKRKH
jgi:hypothetical protein